MSHADCTSIIVSGKIKVFINRKWKQRFCVVARTAFTATVQLFVYKEAADYKRSLDLSAQVPHDTVYGLDSMSNPDKSPVMATIVLTCEDRLVLLGFTCYTDLTFWVEKISESVQDASYRAKFVKCESIGKPTQQQLSPPAPGGDSGFGSSGGDGRLHVQPSRLCFYSEPAGSHQSLAVWPLESVKRYMVNDAMRCFVFEGDVVCGRLRGLQYFRCERRYEIYADMKAACVSQPLPSLAKRPTAASGQSAVASASCATSDTDLRRPAASSSIDIPKPRASQQTPTPPMLRHDDQHRGCSHRCKHRCPGGQQGQPRCRCRCHSHPAGKVQQDQLSQLQELGQLQKLRQKTQHWAVDSGYDGDGSSGASASAAYYNLFALPQQHPLTASREYCNLPGGSAPHSAVGPPPPQPPPLSLPAAFLKKKAATMTAQSATESPSPFAGISRSLTWRRRQNSQQQQQQQLQQWCRPSLEANCRRLVRSSSDLCEGDGGVGVGALVIDSAGSCCGCDPDCCKGHFSDADDDVDDGVCGSCGCDCSSCGSCAGLCNWTAALPPAGSTASDVRMRKPRHGFEYVSRQRVVSMSSSSSGCYANLPLPAGTAGPALAVAATVSPQLNYTEVDHGKTSAFREIAELRSDSRRQQPPHSAGRSNSTSGSSSASSARRSFIRIFQRGTFFRQD